MARKVSVGLEADVAGFLGPVLESARATEKLKDEVQDLDRSLDKIPPDALKAGAAMKLLSGDVKDIGTNFEAVGDKSTAMTVLDSRIKNTRAEVKKLTEEFVKTGDVDVFKKLGQSHGDLSALTTFRKTLSNSIENGLKDGVTKGGPQSASTFSQLFEGGLIQAFSNPYVLAAAGVLALAFGPLLVSAVGGAIIAAGALGAVGLGVAGAAMSDPKAVGGAWSAEIARIKKDWLDASSSFVGPTVAAIHTLGGAVDSIHIDKILQKASTFVGPLAQGVAGFVQGVGGGIEALVSKAGPLIDVLKQELPELGHAIEMSFSAIAGGNKGAADGLRDVLKFIEAVIVGTGTMIRVAEDFYHAMKSVGNAIDSVTSKVTVSGALLKWLDPDTPKAFAVSLDGAAHGLDKTAAAAAAAEPTLDELSQTLSKTVVTVDSLAASMVQKLFSATMGLQQANLSFNESLLNVSDSLKENGRTLDSHTRKGIANQHAILSSVTANMELYQAQVAAGMSSVDAAHNYDVNTGALERQLRKAGLTSAQIDGLIGRYRKIPANVNTAMAIQGLTDAINGLADLLRLINHIPSSKSVTITTHFRTDGTPATGGSRYQPGTGLALGGIRHAADGLIIPPRDPGSVLVGEPVTRGEALIPLGGITQMQAMGLAQVAGNAHGFDVTARGSQVNGQRSAPMPPMQRFEEAFAWMFLRLKQRGAI